MSFEFNEGDRAMRGKAESPVGFDQGDEVVRLPFCPDCSGRGYYLIRPFATGGSNGAGGIGNCTQCQTCLNSKRYYEEHGELPEWLQQFDPAVSAGK